MTKKELKAYLMGQQRTIETMIKDIIEIGKETRVVLDQHPEVTKEVLADDDIKNLDYSIDKLAGKLLHM